jgi:hypothetical protein
LSIRISDKIIGHETLKQLCYQGLIGGRSLVNINPVRRVSSFPIGAGSGGWRGADNFIKGFPPDRIGIANGAVIEF